jgi:type II secretion system protein N
MAPLQPWMRTALKIVGHVAFALFVVILTVFIALPRDRIKERLETLLSDPMVLNSEVTIDSLGLTILTGAGVRGKDIILRTRPLDTTVKPSRFVVDDVTVRFGLIGLAFSRPSYRFVGHGFSGEVEGRFDYSSAEEHLEVQATDLALGGSGIEQLTTGLPVEGKVHGHVEMTLPGLMMANANGDVELNIDDASVGDNKAKVKIPGFSDGLTVPKIQFGDIVIKAKAEKGKLHLESIHIKSVDGEIYIDGFIELRDPLAVSQAHLYVRFKPTDALLKRVPALEPVLGMAGAAKRSDGFFGYQLAGPLLNLNPLPNQNPPPGVSAGGSAPAVTVPGKPPTVATPVVTAAPPAPNPGVEAAPPPPPPVPPVVNNRPPERVRVADAPPEGADSPPPAPQMARPAAVMHPGPSVEGAPAPPVPAEQPAEKPPGE